MGAAPSGRTRVILVCMVDSIHSARWIEQFRDEQVDFVLVPSTPNRQVHPRIRALLEPDPLRGLTVTIRPFRGLLSIPLWGADLILADRIRGALLRRLIRRFAPHYVHALELNHGGYIASRAYESLPIDASPLIATNWGSDIYWFSRYPRHERRLRVLMGRADYYSAECNRDVELAISHGFHGTAFEVFPNTGGFPASRLSADLTAPSTRRTVIIKGYESFVGRASIALRAVEAVAHSFRDYRILIYSANPKTQRLARATARRTGLDITCFPKKALSHQRMLDLFSESRLYLGVSLSDGISTSLLESMVSGCFPIQTNTSCANEWIASGVTGFIVDPNDVAQISASLVRALEDDALVDSAASSNIVTSRARLGDDAIREKSLRFYGLGSSSDINSA